MIVVVDADSSTILLWMKMEWTMTKLTKEEQTKRRESESYRTVRLATADEQASPPRLSDQKMNSLSRKKMANEERRLEETGSVWRFLGTALLYGYSPNSALLLDNGPLRPSTSQQNAPPRSRESSYRSTIR